MVNCHAGAKAMISLLREKIWLINAKEECKRVLRKCVHCFRYKPKLMSQIMGDLPTDRVIAMRSFLVVGVDCCGPVNVSLRIRGRRRSYGRRTRIDHLGLLSPIVTKSKMLRLQKLDGMNLSPCD